MVTKTLLLDEADFIDFRLYGIASANSDSTHFVFWVNQHFQTQFSRTEDLDILIEGQISYYPVFDWEDAETGQYYTIIKNSAYSLNSEQNSGNLFGLFDVAPPLINQFKQYNYLLKVVGDEGMGLPIWENSFIQKIVPLETDSVKQIDRLIF